MDAFGPTLNYYCERQGISLKELAEHMGVSRNTLTNWKARGRPPNQELTLKLAKLLILDEAETNALLKSAGYALKYPAKETGLGSLSFRETMQVEAHSSELQIDLEEAEITYRQNIVRAYNHLNFGGFERGDLSLDKVPLENIFVHLTLTVEKAIRKLISPTEWNSIEQAGQQRQERERTVKVQEPIELSQALSKHLLIVGEPGAGKSTLLRWLAVTFAQQRQRELERLGASADADRLPILVELGHLPSRYLNPESNELPNWLQFLPEHITAQTTFTDISPQLLTRALADGRCLLLFDGLDEIANRSVRERFTRSLSELGRLTSNNRIVIGSRSAGVNESEGVLHHQFQLCQIERFTPEKVLQFFHFWYALDHKLSPEQQRAYANTLYTYVQATSKILELATTPLMSTILILIWRDEGTLPKHKVELYERCCHILIEHWENYHDVMYQGVLAHVGWERHLRLLAPLAYVIHSQEQRTYADRNELIPWLAKCLQKEGLCSESSAATLEAEQFLATISLRSGLLQYMGNNKYGFPHSTFQEYLAARYIAEQNDYIDLVMEHLHEGWWQEVHLLTIGHLGSHSARADKATALILAILGAYPPPNKLLLPSPNPLIRLIKPGKFLPQIHLDRRIAWLLARELELAARGYAECASQGVASRVESEISNQVASFVKRIVCDFYCYESQIESLRVICRSLQRQGNDAVVQAFQQMLRNGNIFTREKAIESLEKIGAGNEAVVQVLLQALHDEEPDVRRAAAASLEKIGAGNDAVVPTLLQALHDEEPDVRRAAVRSLGKLGPGNEAVVPALLQALHDENPIMRRAAATSLGELEARNETIVQALLQVLNDEDSFTRKEAIKSLEKIGAGNEAVVSALLQTLQDKEPDVRRAAVRSLGKLGVGNEGVVQALLQVLHDEDLLTREEAITGLGKLGESNEVVVQALLAALHDPVNTVRRTAAAALGEVGEMSETVVNALLQAAHDETYFMFQNLYMRQVVASSLGKIGTDNEMAIQALIQMMLSKDQAPFLWISESDEANLRIAAAKSLGQIGKNSEAVVTALLQALHDPYITVRNAAVESLEQLEINREIVEAILTQEEKSTEKLKESKQEEHPRYSEYVVTRIKRRANDEGWDVRQKVVRRRNKTLVQQMKSSDKETRRLAIINTRWMEIKDADLLRQILKVLNRRMYDIDDDMRKEAFLSIRQLLDGRSIPDF